MLTREDLTSIFVGREVELQDLEKSWENCQKDGENFVFVYFNAPGVGKTTLLRKFGQAIEKKGVGIHLPYGCRQEFIDRQEFHLSLLRKLLDIIERKKRIIVKYIGSHYTDQYIKRKTKDLELIEEELFDTTQSNKCSMGN